MYFSATCFIQALSSSCCAVYLPIATLCCSYHLYSVLLYNLCVLPKGFLKMEKKKKTASSEVIMYWYNSRWYANGYKRKHSILIVKDWKWGKKKKIKGCWTKECLLWPFWDCLKIVLLKVTYKYNTCINPMIYTHISNVLNIIFM